MKINITEKKMLQKYTRSSIKATYLHLHQLKF